MQLLKSNRLLMQSNSVLPPVTLLVLQATIATTINRLNSTFGLQQMVRLTLRTNHSHKKVVQEIGLLMVILHVFGQVLKCLSSQLRIKLHTKNGATPTIAFTVETPVQTEASKQQDLLYAYTKKIKTVADNECVANLNFRHALSQVVFKAQNKNKNIYVEISKVPVANLKTTGTFTFPTNVTDDHALNNKHDQSGVIADNDLSFGKWGNLSTPAEFTTTGAFGPIPVPCNKKVGDVVSAVGPVNLTNNEGTATGEGSVEANEQQNKTLSLIVLPQELDAATINSTKKPGTEGAYFKVTCLVKNVAKGDGLAATAKDVTLYNGDIYIPVKIGWKVGKKYIYTFVFSEKGHAGYDEKGNDVLIPIEFNVTVDDFAEGDKTNVDADKGNA